MTHRILGIDVSRYNGRMDWQKATNAGAKFAMIRAGVWDYALNAPGRDYEFDFNADIAPHYLPIGFYWPIHTNVNVTQQAEFFAELVDEVSHPVKLWIDVEVDYLEQTPAVYSAKLREFIGVIKTSLDETPGIYTRATFWNPNIQASADWAHHDLWIARYINAALPWGNPGDSTTIKPRDWNNWVFWQWSADAPPNGRGAEFGGQSYSMDINYFNGDEDAFKAYTGQDLPLALEQQVAVLWREAGLHGWNLKP